VGCGTGALTNAICAHADPGTVLGCDPSATFIEYARRHAEDARATFVVAGTGALPRRVGGYGSVTSSLALNFFPDPEDAVHEMRSLTAPHGALSACVWDYGGRMEFLRHFWDAVVTLDPTARSLDEGARFPLCRRDTLADLFRAAGLVELRCEAIEIPTVFASFDDYWRPLLGGTGPAPSYVASLDVDHRAALATVLAQSLQRGHGEAIALTARAWAIRGTVT
jgi:SAM-dependent methyltransferase